MWPQPKQLKHWRELGSFLFEVPPWLSLDPWAFCPWPAVVGVPMPWPTEVLQVEAVCPQTRLAIMGVGATRSVPVCLSSPMVSLSGIIWSIARALALSCSGQGSHKFGYLVSQLCSALDRFSGHCSLAPHLVVGFFIITLHLVGSNHELGIGGPRIAVEVWY